MEGIFRWKGEEFAQDRSGLRCLWDVLVEGGRMSLGPRGEIWETPALRQIGAGEVGEIP